MFCEKCGGELSREGKKLKCAKCSAEYGADYQDAVIAYRNGNKAVEPRGFSNKKHIMFVILGAVLAVIVAIVGITTGVSVSRSQSVAHGFEIAERYLSELNYEQAVIEFQNILEIEPMNVDAYLGLAKAYVGMGDTEKALETLRKGYELTHDERLKDMIDELERVDEPPVSSSEPIVPVEPVETEPEYGSMGFVTIAGTEVDIATTKRLLIINKTKYDEGNWTNNAIERPDDFFDSAVYINNDLTAEEVKELSKLVNLDKLQINYAGANNYLSEIANLTNLTSLDLTSNEISDITPLAKLTNLEYLHLDNNEITDITPLANLTNLKMLYLWNNEITDITPLANLTNLETLLLYNNKISDITPLANLTNLECLYLLRNEISDITPLANLTNLECLCLLRNEISDITPLANLTNLETLLLYNNKISDITPLANLTNLTKLYLNNNEITDITPLAKLTNLTSLDLRSNEISDSDFEWLKQQLPNCDIKT